MWPWKPRVDKTAQQADLFGNYQKYIIREMNNVNGNAGGPEVWGAVTYNHLALPADSGFVLDRLGGLQHFAVNSNQTLYLSQTSSTSAEFVDLGAPVKVLLPYPRRSCTIKNIHALIFSGMTPGTSTTSQLEIVMTAKAVKADETDRTLGSVTTQFWGGTGNAVYSHNRATLRFASPQEITADERIELSFQMRGRRTGGTQTPSFWLNMQLAQSVSMSLTYPEHYEDGRWASVLVEYLN